MHGRVTDVTTGEPIAGATVDIWQASTNGEHYSLFVAILVLSEVQGCMSSKIPTNVT
jgi:hypothetical protein